MGCCMTSNAPAQRTLTQKLQDHRLEAEYTMKKGNYQNLEFQYAQALRQRDVRKQNLLLVEMQALKISIEDYEIKKTNNKRVEILIGTAETSRIQQEKLVDASRKLENIENAMNHENYNAANMNNQAAEVNQRIRADVDYSMLGSTVNHTLAHELQQKYVQPPNQQQQFQPQAVGVQPSMGGYQPPQMVGGQVPFMNGGQPFYMGGVQQQQMGGVQPQYTIGIPQGYQYEYQKPKI